ncbi:MAG: hypothetical protein MUE81_03420 [Thermoflexibacter sp.]|jgi:hypothetical protein|nr:hypothetical protein [Thermoflexibacter sp.]
MNFKKLLKQLGAVGGFSISFAILASIIGSGEAPPEAFLFLSAFLGVGGRSTQLLLQDAKKAQALKDLEISKKLIHLVSANYGKTTLAEIMMKMDMPIPELKAKLEELQKEGILGVEISNSGEMLYTVSNPVSLEDRLFSHKLID